MTTLIAVVSVSSGAETSHTFAFLAIAREDPKFYKNHWNWILSIIFSETENALLQNQLFFLVGSSVTFKGM